ncbi:CDP-diacylglycerol--glycerol-3-phosphate 3-phosphatidyltransferase [Hydrogenimonas thermophila]|uniref:CDP-diacylglycerol--glycerol-3-phosphate 3-phosphatidyltransferase n=1 Tax=Hydrogenimonas thermophila TaxID=223786 RepID=A0A1I5MXN4_9BACT|nr:CDP-diacylglycerol--glycerol-3-phosphate 3-phosphatidyltransferase [Hydrogenimonas thermophila]SFP14314.1 CDP-diacylglycerol--glycerol-3-phosphate 3-phosphatidyltransferase [Hydrogenimonas thermophila]
MIFNLPNILAFSRLLMAPLMLWLLAYRDASVLQGLHASWLDFFAALVFVLASVTDFFDGYIARKCNQITTLGKIIDPLADKMLTLAAFLGLVVLGRADVIAIFLILSREFFITGLRVMIVSEGKDVSASWMGKVKTVAQMFAIGFLTMDWPGGTLLLWIAVAITLYSGYEYIRDYIKGR